jgi:hypothetical protein
MYPERKDMSFRDALNFIRPEHVAFGSGAASLVSNLALSLAEKGDAVLIPAPVSCMQLKMFVFFAFSQFMLTPLLHSFTLSRFKYYAAFDADLKIMAGCIAVPVHSTNPSIGPTPADLEYAATLAEAKGLRVRILLITNPNNPLGTIYPPELVKSAIEWARSRSMHTIVDELYALSVHDQNVVFESVIRTLNNDLRNDVSNASNNEPLCMFVLALIVVIVTRRPIPIGASYLGIKQRLWCQWLSDWDTVFQKSAPTFIDC